MQSHESRQPTARLILERSAKKYGVHLLIESLVQLLAETALGFVSPLRKKKAVEGLTVEPLRKLKGVSAKPTLLLRSGKLGESAADARTKEKNA